MAKQAVVVLPEEASLAFPHQGLLVSGSHSVAISDLASTYPPCAVASGTWEGSHRTEGCPQHEVQKG